MPGRSLQRGRHRGDATATAPVTPSRRRLRSIGALGDGAPCCRSCDRPGTEDCTGFLKKLYGEYGRFVIFPDSAPRHRPGAPKRFIKRMGGKIRACCLPPHAPEPSPAGAQRRSLGKAVGNRPYEGAGEMQESTNAMLLGKEIPIVKTFDHLAR